MVNKKIVYITSNESWGGSEELWTRSAKEFIENNYPVVYASKYNHDNISSLKGTHYLFHERFNKPLFKRIAKRLFRVGFNQDDLIIEMLKKENPALVILSQGNNIDHDNIMKCCRDLSMPYVTITNLVTEYHFLSVNAENLSKLQQDYLRAKRNFFVSANNLELNNLMLAIKLQNAEVIFCPLVVSDDQIPVYPKNEDIYQIGLVGRIECFHKGYDLLLQLAGMEKWRSRRIRFNVYGDGPHKEVLNQNISLLGLNNIVLLKGYAISAVVWKHNQILFMPSRMEGVSLSLLEAMYCKRAAVVTDVGDAAMLIQNGLNGFVADAVTLQSLDDALEKAWDKRNEWEQLGINAALSLRENYSYEAVKYFNGKILKILAELH